MSNLSDLNIRLSEELGSSEINNRTPGQRNRAINDSLSQIYQYRNWRELFTNETIQFVNQSSHIPIDMEKPSALWYGRGAKYYWKWRALSQTDFLNDSPYSFTITEENGIQVLKISGGEENRGFDVNNLVFDANIGINDIAARENVGQTLVTASDLLEGALGRFSIVGSPVGTLTYSIFNTAGGVPTGTALTSGTLNIKEISTTPEYFWVKFNDSLTVNKGDTYSLVIIPSYATDPNNYVQWSYSTTSQIEGSQVLFDGAVWSLGAGDQAFAVCTDYYNLQYVKKFVPLTVSTEDSGLPQRFDQAISKMAAGIIEFTKGEHEQANLYFYGAGGREGQPNQNSAFGLLDLIWQQTRFNSTRPSRRLTTLHDKYDQYNKYNSYPDNYL